MNLMENYDFEALIGGGMTSSVFFAIEKNKQRMVSLKFISKNMIETNSHWQFLQNEIKIGLENNEKSTERPYLLKLFSAFLLPGAFLLVTEPCELRSISWWMDKKEMQCLPSEPVRKVAGCLLIALTTLHKDGFVYRDLKPCNVFIKGTGEIVLGDFGTCRKDDTETSAFPMGTEIFCAPEQVASKPEAKSDIFSLGILIHFLLTEKVPYPIQGSFNDGDFFHNYPEVIERGPVLHTSLSEVEREFIRKCIEPELKNRYSTDEAKRDFYFAGFDFQAIDKMEPPFGCFELEISEKISEEEKKREREIFEETIGAAMEHCDYKFSRYSEVDEKFKIWNS